MPFRYFRSGSRTNKILMAALTALAMFAFIIADALPNGQGGGGSLLTYLPFVLAMAAGALIFWVFGTPQGNGSLYAAVGAGVGPQPNTAASCGAMTLASTRWPFSL